MMITTSITGYVHVRDMQNTWYHSFLVSSIVSALEIEIAFVTI
jgi:hypothetical protein